MKKTFRIEIKTQFSIKKKDTDGSFKRKIVVKLISHTSTYTNTHTYKDKSLKNHKKEES